MKALLLFFLFLWTIPLSGQRNLPFRIGEDPTNIPNMKWHSGWIAFTDGDSLYAEFRFDMPDNVLIMKWGDGQKVFSADKIENFTYKNFNTILFETLLLESRPQFFSVVYDGTIVRWLSRKYHGNPQGWLFTDRFVKNTGGGSFYLHFVKDNRLEKYNGTCRRLYHLLPDKADALRTFVKKRNLDCHDDLDLILDFYHGL